jgi:hypothetical protein
LFGGSDSKKLAKNKLFVRLWLKKYAGKPLKRWAQELDAVMVRA